MQDLQALDERTTAMASDLDAIRRQNEVAQLDREWEREREQYLITGRRGRTSLPSVSGSMWMLVLGLPFGLFWTVTSYFLGAPIVPCFGLVFLGVVVLASLVNYQKAVAYRSRLMDYERRRQELLEPESS
ncbi:MAG: hypothetical protein ACKV0T_14850 [Planctomycetales bacterium]